MENNIEDNIRISKERLASAFERLEDVCKSIALRKMKPENSDILQLRAQIRTLELENGKLKEDCYRAKSVAQQVMEDVNSSINVIEKMLEKENANS